MVFWTHRPSPGAFWPVAPPAAEAQTLTAGSDRDLVSIVVELAPMAALWRRLLIEHRPAPGGRCRACSQGGTGLLNTTWPCRLFKVAHLAFHHTRDTGLTEADPAGDRQG